MKIPKSLLSLIIVFCTLFSGGRPALAATEQIDNFDVTININADSSLDISERIDYDFGIIQRHGIYRDIPIKYQGRGGMYALRISDIKVVDAAGQPYKFEISNRGEYEDIKIGDANSQVTGKKTYIIRYKIKRAINYFGDLDELYWNVTGDEWTVPILKASAHVIFSQEMLLGDTKIECYSGKFGSRSACARADYAYRKDKGNAIVSGADFGAQNLASGEGLTIVVGIAHGLLRQPNFFEAFMDTIKDNWILLLPILVFMNMFYLWWTRGRDPRGRRTIIPEFDVPDHLTPAEVGTIVDEKCGQKEIAGEIIGLAVKGYLKIKEEEDDDYTFTKLKAVSDSDIKDKHDLELMNGLFRNSDITKLSALRGKFYGSYDTAIQDVYAEVYEKGYFSRDPRKVVREYMSWLIVMVLVYFFFLIFSSLVGFDGAYLGLFSVFAIFLSAIIIVIFANAMPQKTLRGVLTKEHILGLKNYLMVAEKDRLEFHNAPQKRPEQFEQLLPYAIALGVEKEWAEQFKGLYDTPPTWYEDARGFNNFNAVFFVSSLGNFTGSFAAGTMATAASGRSGFSGGGGSVGGGGFSGGGFSGGGGGSW